VKPWVRGLTLALMIVSAAASAATAYVSDELVLNVYAEENNQGQRLATLHSGAGVETLSVNGEFTQVRLTDGTTGWVKSAFLTAKEPASFRVKQLEEELERTRATTPALAEAAARSQVDRLTRELALKQAQLDAAQLDAAQPGAAQPYAAQPYASRAAPGTTRATADPTNSTPSRQTLIGVFCGALLAALAVGFWLGYATLARRVRRKFGGIRVY
jgi:SH3 domain protein